MITRDEALVLASQVMEYKAKSYVEAARELSRFVLAESEAPTQLSRLNLLSRLVEQIASADPDHRDELVAEALVVARGGAASP